MEDKDIERMKEIFVTRRECQEVTDSLESKLGKENVRLSVMETELHQIRWLVGLVMAGTVANMLNSFFALIGG